MKGSLLYSICLVACTATLVMAGKVGLSERGLNPRLKARGQKSGSASKFVSGREAPDDDVVDVDADKRLDLRNYFTIIGGGDKTLSSKRGVKNSNVANKKRYYGSALDANSWNRHDSDGWGNEWGDQGWVDEYPDVKRRQLAGLGLGGQSTSLGGGESEQDWGSQGWSDSNDNDSDAPSVQDMVWNDWPDTRSTRLATANKRAVKRQDRHQSKAVASKYRKAEYATKFGPRHKRAVEMITCADVSDRFCQMMKRALRELRHA